MLEKDLERLKKFFQPVNNVRGIFFSAFLRNFFLRQDRLSGNVPPHLVQPCYLALGRALIWGLYPNWFEGFVNWVPIVELF